MTCLRCSGDLKCEEWEEGIPAEKDIVICLACGTVMEMTRTRLVEFNGDLERLPMTAEVRNQVNLAIALGKTRRYSNTN